MRLQGSYVALVTPFRKDGAIDEAAYRKLIRRQLSGGTAGLVPCGSTGEAATLSAPERQRAVLIALEESRGRIPVIAGIGTNVTEKAAYEARLAERLGVDGLLVLSPYYNKPTQDGLFAHFSAVAKAADLPNIVYNIPGRTAVNVLPKTLVKLAKAHANIVAVKEASGNLDQVSEIVATAPKDFVVLSGDDSLTLPMLAVGAKGVISVLANVAPKEPAALCRAFLEGNAAKARQIHLKTFPLVKALFLETNPIPVKAALELMGLCSSSLRLPLTPLGADNRRLLRAELKAFGALR